MSHGPGAQPLTTALDCCDCDEFEETVAGLLAVGGGAAVSDAGVDDHPETTAACALPSAD